VSLPVVLRDEAQAEFDEAFDWYDAQRVGLGSEFVAEVQKVFDRIAANPLMHQTVFADIRKGVVRRFPFSVLYRPHTAHSAITSPFGGSHLGPARYPWRARPEGY
jgi:plasmid stabilization system protein ParE